MGEIPTQPADANEEPEKPADVLVETDEQSEDGDNADKAQSKLLDEAQEEQQRESQENGNGKNGGDSTTASLPDITIGTEDQEKQPEDRQPEAKLERNDSSQVTRATDANGREREFKYSPPPESKLIELTDDTGTWRLIGENKWMNQNNKVWEGSISIRDDGTQVEVAKGSGRIKITNTDGSIIRKDARGNITEITRSNGNKWKFDYKDGELNKVTFPEGYSLVRQSGNSWQKLDENGKTIGHVDDISIKPGPDGSIEYSTDSFTEQLKRNGSSSRYNKEGELIETVRLKEDGSELTTHLKNGEVTDSQIKLKDNTVINKDGDGRVTRVERPDGNVRNFERAADGTITRVTESTGAAWVRGEDGTYTLEGTDEKIKGALTVEDDGSYKFITDNGETITRHIEGFTTRTDEKGQERLRINEDGSRVLRNEKGQITQTMDGAGRWRFYGYNAEGVMTHMQEADGRLWTSDDGKHWKDAGSDATRYGEIRFEADGTRITRLHNGNERVSRSDGSSAVKDQDGNALEVRDRNGGLWRFENDENGDPVRMLKPDGTIWKKSGDEWVNEKGGDARIKSVKVDSDGTVHLTPENGREVVHHTDGWKETTGENSEKLFLFEKKDGSKITKNELGQITSVKDSNGKSRKYEYDAAGRMTRYTTQGRKVWTRGEGDNWHTAGRKDPWVGKIEVHQNGDHHEVSEKSDRTWQTDGSRIERNKDGQITSVRSPGGKMRSFEYEGDQLKSIKEPDGTTWTRGESDSWEISNAKGEKVSSFEGKVVLGQDGLLQRKDGKTGDLTTVFTDGSTVVADKTGLVRERHNDDGSKILFDETGRITEVTDANGTTRSFEYEGRTNRIIRVKNEFGTWTRGEGNEWTKQETGGKWHGDVFVTRDGRYAYSDENGVTVRRLDGLTERTDPEGGTIVTNKDGQVVEARARDGDVRKFEYKDGKLWRVTVPSGNTWENTGGNRWKSAKTGKTWTGEIFVTKDGTYGYRSTNGDESYYKLDGRDVKADYSDADEAAREIYDACNGGLTGIGHDWDRIKKALEGTSEEQRALINKRYEDLYGMSLEAEFHDENIPDAIGLLMRKDDISNWDRLEKDADAIQDACNGGLTGIGTNQEKIYETLKNRSPEERQIINDIFKQKYGWKYGKDWDLKKEFEDEMSKTGYNYTKAMSLLELGEGDVAGRLRVAVLERGAWAAPFSATRYDGACEQDIRDTIRTLNSQQLEDAKADYKSRYGRNLVEDLTGEDSYLSEKSKKALKIYLNAEGKENLSTEDRIKLAKIACEAEDLTMLEEALAGTPKSVRDEFLNNHDGQKLIKDAFGPSLWNALSLGITGNVFSGRELRHAQDYVDIGKLGVDTLVMDNTSWLGDSEEQIEKSLSDMSPEERSSYMRGRALAAGRNHKDITAEEVDKLDLPADQKEDLKYYAKVHTALAGAAGKFYSWGSGAAEMAKWEDMIRFKDGGLLTKIASHRGDIYDDNLHDVLNSIENMSDEEWHQYISDPGYQKEVDTMLDNYLGGTDLAAAREMLNKMQNGHKNFNAAQSLSGAELESFNRGRQLAADSSLDVSKLSEADQKALDFYKETMHKAAVDAGRRDLEQTIKDNLHWWDDKEQNIYDAIQNMSPADRQKYATDKEYREDIDKLLKDHIDHSEYIMAKALLEKVHAHPDQKPEMDILDKLKLESTYWDGDEKKVARELKKALNVDLSEMSDEQKALYRRGEALRQEGLLPDSADLSKEDRAAISFYRQHNLRDRLNHPHTEAEKKYAREFEEYAIKAVDINDYNKYIKPMVEGNLPLATLMQLYDGNFNDDEMGAYELIQDATQKDWNELIADPEKVLPFMNADEREVALNIARQKGEFRVEDKLRAYMLGWGTSEQEIHDALKALTPEQREEVKNEFARKYGISLTSEMLDEMGGSDAIKAMRYSRTAARTARGTWDDARDEYYDSRQGFGAWMVDNTWDGTGFRADELHQEFTRRLIESSDNEPLSMEDAQKLAEDLYEALDSHADSKLALAEAGADGALAIAAVACMFVPGGQAVTAAIASRFAAIATKIPQLARIATLAARTAEGTSQGLGWLMKLSRAQQIVLASGAGGTFRTGFKASVMGGDYDTSGAPIDFAAGAADAATAFIMPQQIARLAGIGREAGEQTVKTATREIAELAVREVGESAEKFMAKNATETLNEGMEAIMREALSTGNYKVGRETLQELAEKAVSQEARNRLGAKAVDFVADQLQKSLAEAMETQSKKALANLLRELALNAPGGALGGAAGGVVRINPDMSVQDNLKMIGLSTAIGGGAAGAFTLGFKGLTAGIGKGYDLTKRGVGAFRRTILSQGDDAVSELAEAAGRAVDGTPVRTGDTPEFKPRPDAGDLVPETPIRAARRLEHLDEVAEATKPPTQKARAQSNDFVTRHEITEPLEDGFTNAGAGRHINGDGSFSGPRAATVIDKQNDAVLRATIDEARDYMKQFKNLSQEEQAEKLAEFVRRKLTPDLDLPPGANPAKYLDDMYATFMVDNAGKRVLLGEFIENGCGGCTQQATLLKVLADELMPGVEVALVRGNGTGGSNTLNHAWTRFKFGDGEPRIFDPRQQRYNLRPDAPEVAGYKPGADMPAPARIGRTGDGPELVPGKPVDAANLEGWKVKDVSPDGENVTITRDGVRTVPRERLGQLQADNPDMQLRAGEKIRIRRPDGSLDQGWEIRGINKDTGELVLHKPDAVEMQLRRSQLFRSAPELASGRKTGLDNLTDGLDDIKTRHSGDTSIGSKLDDVKALIGEATGGTPPVMRADEPWLVEAGNLLKSADARQAAHILEVIEAKLKVNLGKAGRIEPRTRALIAILDAAEEYPNAHVPYKQLFDPQADTDAINFYLKAIPDLDAQMPKLPVTATGGDIVENDVTGYIQKALADGQLEDGGNWVFIPSEKGSAADSLKIDGVLVDINSGKMVPMDIAMDARTLEGKAVDGLRWGFALPRTLREQLDGGSPPYAQVRERLNRFMKGDQYSPQTRTNIRAIGAPVPDAPPVWQVKDFSPEFGRDGYLDGLRFPSLRRVIGEPGDRMTFVDEVRALQNQLREMKERGLLDGRTAADLRSKMEGDVRYARGRQDLSNNLAERTRAAVELRSGDMPARINPERLRLDYEMDGNGGIRHYLSIELEQPHPRIGRKPMSRIRVYEDGHIVGIPDGGTPVEMGSVRELQELLRKKMSNGVNRAAVLRTIQDLGELQNLDFRMSAGDMLEHNRGLRVLTEALGNDTPGLTRAARDLRNQFRDISSAPSLRDVPADQQWRMAGALREINAGVSPKPVEMSDYYGIFRIKELMEAGGENGNYTRAGQLWNRAKELGLSPEDLAKMKPADLTALQKSLSALAGKNPRMTAGKEIDVADALLGLKLKEKFPARPDSEILAMIRGAKAARQIGWDPATITDSAWADIAEWAQEAVDEDLAGIVYDLRMDPYAGKLSRALDKSMKDLGRNYTESGQNTVTKLYALQQRLAKVRQEVMAAGNASTASETEIQALITAIDELE